MIVRKITDGSLQRTPVIIKIKSKKNIFTAKQFFSGVLALTRWSRMYCALTSIARRWSFTISRITPLRSRVGNGQRRFRIINERAATSGRSRDSKNNFVLRGSKTWFIEAFRESPFSSSSAVTCQTVFPDRKRTPLTLLMARQNDAVQGEPRSFISLRQNTEDKQSGI